jgi:hypothetical protein
MSFACVGSAPTVLPAVPHGTCASRIPRITRQSVSGATRDSASASDRRQSLFLSAFSGVLRPSFPHEQDKGVEQVGRSKVKGGGTPFIADP